MSASKTISSWLPAIPSRNPALRSCPGVEVISPFSSTTFPLPPSRRTAQAPAARPMALLFAPMKQV
jgi:hypothetical protein